MVSHLLKGGLHRGEVLWLFEETAVNEIRYQVYKLRPCRFGLRPSMRSLLRLLSPLDDLGNLARGPLDVDDRAVGELDLSLRHIQLFIRFLQPEYKTKVRCQGCSRSSAPNLRVGAIESSG